MDYKSNHRNQIRKGLSNCEIVKLDFNKHREKIYDIYKSNMVSYGRDFVDEFDFGISIDNETNLKDAIEYYGSFVGSELVGYSKNLLNKSSSMVFYETINIYPEYKRNYISYALIHRMNFDYLNEHSYKFVCDGSRNLLHETGIQNFLISKFKFRKAYCDLQLIYNWKVRVLLYILWPFRSSIFKLKHKVFKNLQSLLFQHSIFIHHEL